jgi:hypothetical protein
MAANSLTLLAVSHEVKDLMPGENRSKEPFYFDEEVVDSSSSYHRPSCHVIRQIYRRNYKRLRNWQECKADITSRDVCRRGSVAILVLCQVSQMPLHVMAGPVAGLVPAIRAFV